VRASALVIGSNRVAVEAAAREASAAGYAARALSAPLAGDCRDAAALLAGEIAREVEAAAPTGRRCLLAGGETTVVVRGSGRGGRNQELALALAPELDGLPVAVLCAGSDGIDGPTDAAGAFVDGSTMARASRLGLDPGRFLLENDSYTFFDRLGDLFRTGPTGTNVMDLALALVG
jgi:hydroxypyruvate reductase